VQYLVVIRYFGLQKVKTDKKDGKKKTGTCETATKLYLYTLWLKNGLLLYFQMTSTHTDQYPKFLVQIIHNESPVFTCVNCEF